MRFHYLVAVFLIAISACEMQSTPEDVRLEGASAVDDAVLESATPDGDWLTYGGNYAEDRYSTLEQITKGNVDQLGLVWSYDF